MASQRICSVEGCGKPHKGRGFCGKHLLRFRKYGDPLYVVPVSERDYSHNRRPRKIHVDADWLRAEYHEKMRPVGDIATDLGCCVEHLNFLVVKHGLPRRDGRAGRVMVSARRQFDLARASWLYEVQRMNCADIGTEMGVHGDTVRRRLREAGIRIRHHNDTKRGAKPKTRTKINERAVVRMYYEPGQSIKTVAEHFGVERGIIGRILHERGAPIKHITEVRETLTGPDHHSWRHDISDEEREQRRDANKQAEWRDKVYARDGFACRRCGDDRGGNLNAHHIEGHSYAKEIRWEVSNGVTLCADCHRAFHRRYGLKGFGQPELDEFLSMASA